MEQLEVERSGGEKRKEEIRKLRKKKITAKKGFWNRWNVCSCHQIHMKKADIISFKISMVFQVHMYVICLLCNQTLCIVLYQLSKKSPHYTTDWTIWIWLQRACKIKRCACKTLYMHMKLQIWLAHSSNGKTQTDPRLFNICSLQRCVTRACEWGKCGKQVFLTVFHQNQLGY